MAQDNWQPVNGSVLHKLDQLKSLDLESTGFWSSFPQDKESPCKIGWYAVYAMHAVKLPVTFCDQLDRLKLTWLNGAKFAFRSLLKNMRVLYLALLVKNSWRLMQGDTDLWAKVFSGIY